MNKRNVGDRYEQLAVKYLVSQGYEILERNFRNKYGEIDIIARDGNYLAFIEVKYRKSISGGNPFEAVNYSKQRRITRTALYYCAKNSITEYTPMRFDVVGILDEKIELFKNAFEAVM